MEDGYRRQVRGLLDGGTDVLLIETCFDLLQIKAAVAAATTCSSSAAPASR
jgi:5-methyltetrahydrofolate--homocysteine methyltransferase